MRKTINNTMRKITILYLAIEEIKINAIIQKIGLKQNKFSLKAIKKLRKSI